MDRHYSHKRRRRVLLAIAMALTAFGGLAADHVSVSFDGDREIALGSTGQITVRVEYAAEEPSLTVMGLDEAGLTVLSQELWRGATYDLATDQTTSLVTYRLQLDPAQTGVFAIVARAVQSGTVTESAPWSLLVYDRMRNTDIDRYTAAVLIADRVHYVGEPVVVRFAVRSPVPLVRWELQAERTQPGWERIEPDLITHHGESDPPLIGYERTYLWTPTVASTHTFPAMRYRLQAAATATVVAGSTLEHTVRIAALPTAGRPEGPFVIGSEFSIEVDPAQTAVDAGYPLRLRIVLAGSGSLAAIDSVFPAHRNWIVSEELTTDTQRIENGTISARKAFDVTVYPRGWWSVRLPEIALNVFDPDSASYRTVASDRTRIRIRGSAWRGRRSQLCFWCLLVLATLLVATGGVIWWRWQGRRAERYSQDGDQAVYLEPESPDPEDLAFFHARFRLTDRERDILLQVLRGVSTKVIAAKLFISPETTKKHIQNLFKKTDTHSRFELYTLYERVVRERMRA